MIIARMALFSLTLLATNGMAQQIKIIPATFITFSPSTSKELEEIRLLLKSDGEQTKLHQIPVGKKLDLLVALAGSPGFASVGKLTELKKEVFYIRGTRLLKEDKEYVWIKLRMADNLRLFPNGRIAKKDLLAVFRPKWQREKPWNYFVFLRLLPPFHDSGIFISPDLVPLPPTLIHDKQ